MCLFDCVLRVCTHCPVRLNLLSQELSDFLLNNCFVREVAARPNAKVLMEHVWITSHQKPEQVLNVQGLTTQLSAESAARAAGSGSLAQAFQPPEPAVAPVSPTRSKKSGRPDGSAVAKGPATLNADLEAVRAPPSPSSSSSSSPLRCLRYVASQKYAKLEKEKAQLLRSVEELNARLARALQDKEAAEKQLKATQATLQATRNNFASRLHAMADEILKYGPPDE